jgi:hypothetical protein
MTTIRLRYLALASFFIAFGLLLLLNNYEVFSFLDTNSEIRSIQLFWPFGFVLIALYFVFKGSKINYLIVSLTSIFVALMIFVMLVSGMIKVPFLPSLKTSRTSLINPNITITTDVERYINSIKEANLNFKSEKGDFFLRGTTDSLTEYTAKSTFGEYIFDKSDKDNIATVDLRFDTERFPWKVTSDKNSLDLKLSPKPQWNLDYEVANSNLDMQLGYYNIKNAKVKSSTSTVDIQIERDTFDKEMKLEVDASSSNINLRVQKGVGIEIKYKSLLSIKDFNSLEDKGSDTFRTKDFDNAEQKLYIDVDISVSKIKLEIIQ